MVVAGFGLSLAFQASMRRLAIVKRGSRRQLQLGANVNDRASIRTLGGVISSTRCSMKFGPGGAARSVSASQAGREHAVAANAVSDVVGR